MIALLSGEVAVRRPDHVVVSCGGVGYRLAVSAETLRQVPAAGKPATLHTHLIVRDDALPRPDHAADALAVAICHANSAPMRRALAHRDTVGSRRPPRAARAARS